MLVHVCCMQIFSNFIIDSIKITLAALFRFTDAFSFQLLSLFLSVTYTHTHSKIIVPIHKVDMFDQIGIFFANTVSFMFWFKRLIDLMP